MTTSGLHFPDPPVAARQFILRPWEPNDAADVVAACSDPLTQRFITQMPRPYTLEHAEAFIAQASGNVAHGRAIGMAVGDAETGQAIGSITLHANEPQHWSVGYWMAPAWRNKGITTNAVRALTRWAFAAYPSLIRVSLYTLVDNVASQRVAARAGFRREGVLRSWDYASGEPEDVVMFSLLRHDVAPE